MPSNAAALPLSRKISAAFFAFVALIIGAGIWRSEGLGNALIMGGVVLLCASYSLFGNMFAAWPWRVKSNWHRALWLAIALCELAGLVLLVRGVAA